MVKEKSAALLIAVIGIIIIGIAAIDQVLRTSPPSTEAFFLAGVMIMGAGLLSYAFLDQRSKLRKMRRLGARLRRSEARFRSLVTSQGDVIVRCDMEGKLTFVNDIFGETFGLQSDSVLGRQFYPKTKTDGSETDDQTWCHLPEGEDRFRIDQFMQTVSGWRWFAWERCAIRDRSGDIIEVQSIGRDITQRKKLEEQLDEARIAADKASTAKSRFLATMSHEIRTPMNGILGMAGLLLESKLTPDQQTYASAIQQSGEGLLTLINDILDYSKIESGKIGLNPIGVDVRFMVERMAELLAPRAFDKNVDFAVHVSPDVPPLVLADEGRLRQVLFNLVGNALKFTSSGGVSITVSRTTFLQDSKVALKFSIQDTGPGIEPEDQDRLFEEFEQGDLSAEQAQGSTGLGLAISKRIIEAMGGKIGLLSDPGAGSIFWFEVILPCVNDGRTSISTNSLSTQNILIVGTPDTTQHNLEQDLKCLGAEVTSLPRGEDPLSQAITLMEAGRNFTAIICDGEIAHEIGTTLCTAAEQIATKQGKPVPRRLIMLPLGDQSKLTAVEEYGFDGYLLKPVRQRSLVSQLQDAASADGGRLDRPATPDELNDDEEDAAIRILLAEDNQVNALLARTLLNRDGHDVEIAKNGIEVLHAVENGTFDLILMDIHMPKMDGLEATRQLRTGRFSHIPIIALTANAMMEDQDRCAEAGMDDYLSKPVDPVQLSEKVAFWAIRQSGTDGFQAVSATDDTPTHDGELDQNATQL